MRLHDILIDLLQPSSVLAGVAITVAAVIFLIAFAQPRTEK
jgi:hypothetical protein